MNKNLLVFILLATPLIVLSEYTGNCRVNDQYCSDYGKGPFCCNSTEGERCFQGYHSGVCCTAPETGCCGDENGYALDGCKCITSNQQCCGNVANTVCGADQTCCISNSGHTGTCCNDGETCKEGVCVQEGGYTPPCQGEDTLCQSLAGSKCCDKDLNQSCYQGYQSGVCCTAPSVGCCGKDGYALGGCKCRTEDEQCCGNIGNTICGADQTCCISSSGDGSCCNDGETCSDGVCVSEGGYNPPCQGEDTLCMSLSGGKCCDKETNQTCYQGYQSGVCCTAPNVGCCGEDGYALGGCKCRTEDQQCCGNIGNTICGIDQTCCVVSGGDTGTCCNSGEVCHLGSCIVPTPTCTKQCGAGDACCNDVNIGQVCYNPQTHSCVDDRVLCGAGLDICNDICFNPATHVCLTNGAGQSKLCGKSNQLCGTSCYNPLRYNCVNNILYPK